MKKFLSISFVAAMALSLNAGVLASVKGTDITVTDEDIAPVFAQNPHATPSDEDKKQLIDQMIKFKLMIAEAKKSGIVNSEEYKKQVELAKDEIAFALWQQEQTKDVKVTDEEAKKIYDDNKDSFMQPESVVASHILLKDEKEAKDAIAKLEKVSKDKLKAEFNKLAKEISTDPSAKENGGDLGSFGKGMMVSEFEEAAWALNKGEISKTPVKTQFGYHVIYKEDLKEATPVEFDKVKEMIKAQIAPNKLNKKIDDIANELFSKQTVEYAK